MISPRSNFRSGDRIGGGPARAIASAATKQAERDRTMMVNLANADGRCGYRSGQVYLNGVPQPVRVGR